MLGFCMIFLAVTIFANENKWEISQQNFNLSGPSHHQHHICVKISTTWSCFHSWSYSSISAIFIQLYSHHHDHPRHCHHPTYDQEHVQLRSIISIMFMSMTMCMIMIMIIILIMIRSSWFSISWSSLPLSSSSPSWSSSPPLHAMFKKRSNSFKLGHGGL